MSFLKGSEVILCTQGSIQSFHPKLTLFLHYFFYVPGNKVKFTTGFKEPSGLYFMRRQTSPNTNLIIFILSAAITDAFYLTVVLPESHKVFG